MVWLNLADVKLEYGHLLNKAENFQGYPFRASMFERFPTLIPATELPSTFRSSYFASAANYAAGFGGFDGLVLGNLAQLHNFKVMEIKTDSYYGVLTENNTFTGWL